MREKIITDVIYELRRNQPTQVDLVEPESVSVNLDTGIKTVTHSAKRIRDAVVLAGDVSVTFSMDLSYLAASRDFTEGALYEKQMITVLLDDNQLGSWVPNGEQIIIVWGSNFNVTRVRNVANRIKSLTGVLVEGGPTIRFEPASNALNITDTGSTS